MKAGSAIGEILKGLELRVHESNVKVKYEYGNQNALDEFVSQMNQTNNEVFPLVFYVTSKSYKSHGGWKWYNTKLWLFTNTKPMYLSKKRTIATYENILEPLFGATIKRLDSNHFYQNMDNVHDRYNDEDIPNIGVSKNQIGAKVSDKSAFTDHVDAKVIDLNFRIKTNCIKQ